MKIRHRASAAQAVRPLFGLLVLAAMGAGAQGLSGGMGSNLGMDYGSAGVGVNAGGSGRGSSNAEDSGGRPFYMVPTLTVGTTFTNNVNLSATDKKSDLILDIRPGIHLGGQSGRLRGFLDYQLQASLHARHDESSNPTSVLSARGNAELVPSWLFLDANASISQQAISPFGALAGSSSLNNDNRTQVTTVNVAPHMRGQIAGQVNYVGRAFYTYTDSGTSQASDSSAWGGLLGFDSTTRWSRLSWGLDFSYREAKFDNRRSEFDQLNVLSLNYAITPELRVSVRGNVEKSNLTTLNSEVTTGWGGGLRWNPSPRTNFIAEYDQRVFGNSHLISLDYRTPRTVWAFSNRQGLSTGQNNVGQAYSDADFDRLYKQFEALIPDPVQRRQLVLAILQGSGGYLPNQVTLERRQEASVSWLGLRDTLIFNLYQTQSKALQPGMLNPDDPLAGGNVLQWRGVRTSWSHRLSPLDTLTANVWGQRTTESFGGQDTTVWTGTLMWSRKLAERVNLSLTGRYTTQTGSTNYDEAALLAFLNMSF